MKETTNTPGIRLKEGLVPDAKTAIAIAVAVWTPVYGAEQIAAEKPYNVMLKSGKWTVTGSVSPGRVGGVATAVIEKSNARVVKIYHTK